MTYRTFDIDAGSYEGCAVPSQETSNPARRARSRRHSAVMGHRISGARMTGFGF